VVVPHPLIMIGISPKSFGYYYFNDLHVAGYAFLDNANVSADVREALQDVVLPGGCNNTHWLFAVETARRALLPDHVEQVNIERYRLLQMVERLRDVFVKRIRQSAEADAFSAQLQIHERQTFELLKAAIQAVSDGGNGALGQIFQGLDSHLAQHHAANISWVDIGVHATIRDAFDWLGAQSVLAVPPESFLNFGLEDAEPMAVSSPEANDTLAGSCEN
jgi:hypothetical protein